MSFNSFEFAAFFAVVYLFFLIIPAKLRCWYLVVASFVFYSAVSVFASGILLFVSLLSYFGGLKIAEAKASPTRQNFWLIGVVGFLGVTLCYFKYFSFITSHLALFLRGAQSGQMQISALLMPLGLSYYIFQAVGYLVDVYWGKEKEENLGRYILFLSFFPKVMMGPIERSENFLPQIRQLDQFKFDYNNFREGALLFSWGLFKKIVVAERLGYYVNEWYADPGHFAGVPMIFAAVFYSFQIYSDFSGYTDMALGLARLFNFRLINNFDRPFHATTIPDFWRRWHISFSSWISAYIFTPLCMQFRDWGNLGLYISTLITFLLVGIWHGTGWTFFAFGLSHGILICLSTATLRARNSFWKKKGQKDKTWLKLLRRIVVFSMVTLSFVFFRAESLEHAWEIFKSILSLKHLSPLMQSSLGIDRLLTMKAVPEFAIALGVIIVMEMGDKVFHVRTSGTAPLFNRPWWVRWPAYAGLALLILCLGFFTEPKSFIYLNF